MLVKVLLALLMLLPSENSSRESLIRNSDDTRHDFQREIFTFLSMIIVVRKSGKRRQLTGPRNRIVLTG